jgi:hypothetical protein
LVPGVSACEIRKLGKTVNVSIQKSARMKDTLVCPQVNHWKKKIEENESVEAHPFS